jgi:hypothetical protein
MGQDLGIPTIRKPEEKSTGSPFSRFGRLLTWMKSLVSQLYSTGDERQESWPREPAFRFNSMRGKRRPRSLGPAC